MRTKLVESIYYFKASERGCKMEKSTSVVVATPSPINPLKTTVGLEIVKWGFWHTPPLLPLLWHANAADENKQFPYLLFHQ